MAFGLSRPRVAGVKHGLVQPISRPRPFLKFVASPYLFHGATAAGLAHAIVKEHVVPPANIERVIERRRRFEADPETRTYVGEGGSHDES